MILLTVNATIFDELAATAFLEFQVVHRCFAAEGTHFFRLLLHARE
jgi:hypothetical protein